MIAWLLLTIAPGAATPPESARHFRIEEAFTVAAGTGQRVLFVPLPEDDPWQKVRELRVDVPFERVRDGRFGDAAAKINVPPAGMTVHVAFEAERHERTADLSHAVAQPAPSSDYAVWLGDEAHVKIDDRIRGIAAAQTKGIDDPAQKARALYEYVLKTMRYEKKGDGWGRGDLAWACDMKYGNCTDFHAMLSGLLRAVRIPARFQIGYSIPSGNEGDIPGYHCWMDFYLQGAGWVPVDASEAWKHPEKREYFFGHHDADRVALSTGRDVTFPGMKGPPLNYFVFPYLEVNGEPGPAPERKVRFTALR